MNKLSKILLGLGLVLAVVYLLGNVVSNKPLGAVIDGQAYVGTTTRSTSGSASASYVAKTGQGTFGGITVNQVATAGYVRVFDATSTATSTVQSANAKSTGVTVFEPLAQVQGASDAAGTLTYDREIYKGIVVETSSDFNGEYTITWK